jgi:hypothetical protein
MVGGARTPCDWIAIVDRAFYSIATVCLVASIDGATHLATGIEFILRAYITIITDNLSVDSTGALLVAMIEMRWKCFFRDQYRVKVRWIIRGNMTDLDFVVPGVHGARLEWPEHNSTGDTNCKHD